MDAPLSGGDWNSLVAIAKATVLLLAGGVPHIVPQRAKVRVEVEGVDGHADGGCAARVRLAPQLFRVQIPSNTAVRMQVGCSLRPDIFLLELARQVTLDESCLTDTTVADQDELELDFGTCCSSLQQNVTKKANNQLGGNTT